MLIMCVLAPLSALTIVDNRGVFHEYPYEQFFKLQAREFSTSKEVDGETVINTWKGIRFDTWLKEQKLGDFAIIRFLSNDRYAVSFNKAEWDTLTCYLAYEGEGEIFPKEQLRIIFPHLRSMHWVRDVRQVFLENHKQVPLPVKFMPISKFFAGQEILRDPKPFVRLQGYRFDDFIGTLSDAPIKDVVIYSRDGLVQNLSYPAQLAGAVLELTDDGKYNLKSPQIPGGMWMKDIVYLQADHHAVIDTRTVSVLIPLAKTLDWEFSPQVKLILHYAKGSEELVFGDALAEPMLFDEIEYFRINP
jgi:hypothetical protein